MLTFWGKMSSCEFAVFMPVFQCCFAIIITIFFIICGKGGGGPESSNNSFLPQPWRIVIVSLVFFISMLIISVINLVHIKDGSDAFCRQFKKTMPDVSCIVLISHFKMTKFPIVPGILYILLIVFSWTLVVCWSVLTLIMILRIVFVIDFQLVRVTVRTCEFENENVDGNEKFKLKDEHVDDESDGNTELKEPTATLATSEC